MNKTIFVVGTILTVGVMFFSFYAAYNCGWKNWLTYGNRTVIAFVTGECK